MTSQALKESDRIQDGVTTSRPLTGISAAIGDISDALAAYRIALIFGWQDVAQRYRRSRLGAFWLTINMAVYIGALGLIFGTLFRSNMQEYLPHICTGVIVWGLISSSLLEGCTTFSGASGIILQVRLPLFTHILRALWKNIIIFSHNILIVPVLYLILGRSFNFYILLIIPGFLILCFNLAWIMVLLATICCRFRDMTQIITNILQIFFYLTPIIWTVKVLPKTASRLIFELNPFYHFLQLIRAPLFGEPPALTSWLFAIGIAIAGWLFTLVFFGKYRWRIPYWL
ncbi:ABC transporter permease [Brucella anthropi]|uniref:ABC transporter permease n=1 Tax=Brucella anthropi TaxID=529 RepID=UPI00124D6BBD|nr:ABC transporter permease [Brucella anthropi]KAB2790807.1 ABC transporter permease [Brucella anthropi]